MATNMEEGKDTGVNDRPVNLLARILQKCQQMAIIDDKEKEQKADSSLNHVEVEQTDLLDLDTKKPNMLLENICSSVETVNRNTKLKLLTALSSACKDNPLLYETVGSSQLVYFTEKLLKNYCKKICKYWDQIRISHCETSELILLIPLLELLSLSVNMSVQQIRSIFLYNSEVLLHLMQAVTQCCYNVAVTHMKLHDVIYEKKLDGALYEMHHDDVQALFTNWLGFPVPTNRLKGYDGTLFEVSDVREMNINQYVIKKQPPSGSQYTEIETEVPIVDLVKDSYEDVSTAEWSHITVARLVVLKTALIYTREDWEECLFHFSSQLKDILQLLDEDTYHQHPTGSMCGFRSTDALFEGESLMKVPHLRGQVLALTGDWAMIWAVDIGVIGFVPKAKLCFLPQGMETEPWLIRFCQLRGPISKMDEGFLKAACKLLCVVLETNTQIGKHMLLNEMGKNILSITEYPEVSIRLAILRLLLCLAKNSRDIISFFQEEQYDQLLIGKLEKLGHAYTSKLYINKESMEQEIEVMLMILQLILEQRDDIRNWPDNRRVSKVIWMYICDKNCKWRELLEKCLSILSGKSKQMPQRRGYSGQHRGRGQGRHYHNNSTRISDDNERNTDFRGAGDSGQRYRGTRENYRESNNYWDNGQRHSDYRDRRPNGRYRDRQDGQRNSQYRDRRQDGQSNSEYQRYSTYGQSRRNTYNRNNFEGKRYMNSYENQSPFQNKRLDMQKRLEQHSRDLIESQENNSVKENDDYEKAVCNDVDSNDKKSLPDDSEVQGLCYEDDHRMLMRRTGSHFESANQRDEFSPHQPFLPMLNRLRKPSHMPRRLPATYLSLLEMCDEISSAPAVSDTEPVKLNSEVNLDSDIDYVIYGSKAEVKCDKTHEFILDKEVWDMKEVVLAEKLCGLLNNNIEGSLYFGLSADSIIEGIWFGRGDKDTFRNGIDRVMNRCLIPEVRANSYDIIFTPVIKSGDKLTDISKHSLFIVEIRVRPLVHMVYMVYQNRKCYTRHDTETIECTVAQKKKDMMDEEELALEESMQALEAAANQDLPTLAKLIGKFISNSDWWKDENDKDESLTSQN